MKLCHSSILHFSCDPLVITFLVGAMELRGHTALSSGFESGNFQQMRQMEEFQRQLGMMRVQLSELELQLQASLASTYNGNFLWRIPDVTRRRRDAVDGRVTSIYSPPFYTGRSVCGYSADIIFLVLAYSVYFCYM